MNNPRGWFSAFVLAASAALGGAAHAQLYQQSSLLSRSARLEPPAAPVSFLKQSVPSAEPAWIFGARADAVVDIGSEDDRALVVPFALGWTKEQADVTWSVALDSDGFVHAWSPDSRSGLSDLRLSAGGTWKLGSDARLTPVLTLVIPTRSNFGSDDAALALGLGYARSLGKKVGLGATYSYTRVDASKDEPGSRRHDASLSLDVELIPEAPFTLILGRELARSLPGATRAYVQQTLPWKPLPGTTSYVFYRWSRAAGERAHGIGGGLSYAF